MAKKDQKQNQNDSLFNIAERILSAIEEISGSIATGQDLLSKRTYAIKGDAYAANSFAQLTNRKMDYLIDLEKQRIQSLCHEVNQLATDNRALLDENLRLRLQIEALTRPTDSISNS